MHALLIYIKHLNLQLKLLENVSISYSTGNKNAKKITEYLHILR